MNRLIKILNAKQWPKEYDCEFIAPGLVSYKDIDCGICRLDKETIDSMLPSFIGKPLTILHQKCNPGTLDKVLNGVVTGCYYNAQTGKFHAKFIATTDEAHQRIADGDSVSCAYDVDVSTLGPGGTMHGIPYHQQINGGTFTHLAIVPADKARYEDSYIDAVDSGMRVFQNSKGEGRLLRDKPKQEDKSMLKFKFHFPLSIEKVENSVDPENTFVDIKGKKVSVKALIDAHNSKKQENVEEVSEDSQIEILNSKGEKVKVSVKDLVEAYNSTDEDEAMKKKTEDDEKKEMENAMDDDQKKEYGKMDDEAKCTYRKNMKERKNAKEKEEKEAQDKKAMENATKVKELENARTTAKDNLKTFTVINSRGAGQKPEATVVQGTKHDGTKAAGLQLAKNYFGNGKTKKA